MSIFYSSRKYLQPLASTLFLSLWLIRCYTGAAQPSSFSINNTASQIIPPAPKTAGLGTFGRLPVDLNTGAVSVSVPVVEVASGPLRIPIALRYNSTGIRVSEVPSWVGQGWQLNAGGVITRTVRGQPDETPYKGYQAVWQRWRHADSLSALNIPNSGKHRLDIQAYNENWDLEADTYTVSIPGLSATIAYDAKGHYTVNPIQGWQIVSGGPAQGAEWLLVAPDGTRYHFGGGIGEETTTMEAGPAIDPSSVIQEFVNAWHLTAIESADRHNRIEFSYTSDGPSVKVNLPQIYQVKFAPVGTRLPNSTGIGSCNACLSDPPSTGPLGQAFQAVTSIWQRTISLYEIRSPTQRLQFDSDLLVQQVGQGQFPTEPPRRLLRRIRLLGQENNTPARVYQFQFRYDGIANDSAIGRHYLVAMREVGKPPTQFIYNNTALPLRTSFAQDHWGYYNGAGNTSLIPQLPYVWRQLLPWGGKRVTVPSFQLAGSLSSITYPTGGSTYFTYEANQALAPVSFDVDEPTLGERRLDYYAAANGGAILDSVSQHVYDALYSGGYQGIGQPFVNAQLLYLPDGARSLNWQAAAQNPPSSPSNPNPTGNTAPDPVQLFVRLNSMAADPIAEALARQPVSGEPRYPAPAGQSIPSSLPAGTYLLLAICFDPNASASLGVSLIPSQLPPSPGLVERTVGGLRIQRQVDYAGPSAPDSLVTTYQYTMPDTNTGQLITSGILFDVPNYLKVTPCGAVIASARDNTLLPKDAEGGFHVGYKQVTITRQRATTGGTTTTTYLNTVDPTTRSLVEAEVNRDASGKLVSEVRNVYDNQVEPGVASAKLQLERFLYRVIQDPGGDCSPVITDTLFNSPVYHFTPHYFPLVRSVERRYEPLTGRYWENTTLTRYTPDIYGHLRLQPTEVARVTTPGDTLLSWYRYVADYDTTGTAHSGSSTVRGLADLASRSVTALPVEERQGHGTAAGRRWTAGSFTEYATQHPRRRWALEMTIPQSVGAIAPSAIVNGQFLRPTAYILSADYERYSAQGELVQLRQPSGRPLSFLWGNYQPIAEAKNAPYARLAYTSFEQKATGRWTYDSTGTHRVLGGRTGRWAYRLDGSGQVSRSQLPVGDYELTYWAQGPVSPRLVLSSGSQLGSGAVLVAGAPNDWHQYRTQLHFTALGSITLQTPGGSGVLLDEVRLCPVGAQLTSYTHDPLVGMTSQTGPDGHIQTYEYDGLGRLVRTRDEQGRILGQQQYHYAGQR